MEMLFAEGHRLIDTQQRLDMLIGVCSALTYLHKQVPAIAHGDLKPANILLESKTLKPKVVDFGLCRRQKPRADRLGGTLRWMAPEALTGNNCMVACSADVFSFGCVAFFVVTNLVPNQGLSAEQMKQKLKNPDMALDFDW